MLKKFCCFLLAVQSIYGQVPDTDIWLFDIDREKEQFRIGKGENVSNRPGYDNQPFFTQDGKNFYYVSIREDKQADIYLYDTRKKKSTRVTQTAESEYSPGNYNDRLNCVVVENDSTQRTWSYDAKTGLPKNILFNQDSVGYYAFLNSDTVLYYKLTRPHSLRAHCISTSKDIWLADNPSRGFKMISRHEFIYGIKDSAGVTFYLYDALLKKGTKYAFYPSASEDIIWHSGLGLLKSENAAILRYDSLQQKWTPLFDFSAAGIKKITRFCISNKTKKIAVVSNL